MLDKLTEETSAILKEMVEVYLEHTEGDLTSPEGVQKLLELMLSAGKDEREDLMRAFEEVTSAA